jgi:hypothetical protein
MSRPKCYCAKIIRSLFQFVICTFQVEEKLARLTKEISSCSSKESVEQLSQSMSERHAQMSGELQQVNDKLSLVQVTVQDKFY